MKKPSLNLLFVTAVGLASVLPSNSVRGEVLYVANSTTIQRFTSNGAGFFFSFDGLSQPFAVAFDRTGVLYAANVSNNTIVKFTPGGVGSVFANTGLSSPYGLAFDSLGNLYVSNLGNSTIVRFTPAGVGSVFADPGLSEIYSGLAFDSSGNLYAAGNNAIVKFTPSGVRSVFATSALSQLRGLAFDRAGNLYASHFNNDRVEKFTPAGIGSVFANSGLNRPLGLAFDRAGNLYASNYGDNTIVKFTPDGVGSLFANTSLNFPTFLAFAPVPSKVVRVAGFSTAIPGGTGSFLSLPRAPGYSSSGQAAFYGAGSGGQQGIYRAGTSGPPITIADLNTTIPGGTGNFTSFIPSDPTIPSIDGDNVAFFGAGSGGQQGIYVMQNGPPIRIADIATAIPGGTGNFTTFTRAGSSPNPIISGNKVAFFGAGSGGQQGVYVLDYVALNGPPIKIADTATAIPGGTGNFTAIPVDPYISGDNVAFLGIGSAGQQGIYRAGNNGPPIKIADLNTAIPSGAGNFTSFIPGDPIAPAINGTSVAFFGAGSGGQQGIYVMGHGPPIRIADTATVIPGGTGNFTTFVDVSLSVTDVVFLGLGANGQQGIYDMTGGSLVKVIDLTDILDGRSITGLQFSRTGLVGDPVAFQANFADGSQGIYTTAAVPIFTLRITAVEQLGADLRLSFTSQFGSNYSIQSRADLSSGTWVTLPGTTNSGTGGILQQTLSNPFANPKQFYRVQEAP